MAMMKKWLLTSVMAVALVFVSFANTVHITFAEGKTATLAIIGESQKGVILCPKEVSIEDGETAYSLLQKAMGDKVIAENTKYGMYVKGIDGLMGGDTSGWTYDVNDKAAMVGADSYKLDSGDIVAFRFVADWNNMSQETLQQALDRIGTCKSNQDEQKPDEQNPGEQNPDEQKPDTTQPKEPITNELLVKQLDQAIAKTSQKMMNDGIDSDWTAIALARSGQNVPIEMKVGYLQSLTQKVEKQMNRLTPTDLARTVLAVTAVNGNPRNVAGQNLIQKLYQSEKLNSVTGYTFALIALDTKKYEVPAEVKWNRAALVKEILDAQHTDGGWTYNVESGKEDASSVDVTGMVLSALTPYQKQPEVKQAVEKAVQYLSSKQLNNGGFEADGQENSNSAAQAVMGLSMIGSDPTGDAFTKNNVNAVQNLLSYQLENGEFKWLPNDTEGNSMATEQALLALLQYKEFVHGNGSIYDWSNDTIGTEIDKKPVVEQEIPAVEKEKVTEEPQQQTKGEVSDVVVKEKTVNNEKTAKNRQLPKTGSSAGDVAVPVGMGVLCIASAYALWRRKAA
ncbi:DUF4430 domain-containing protein [Bacillus sp. NPDC094106]|uniref:DUF4430 domain-containing protein n=1 Tax=Bacillus sp. NPDC094106 TaxID=3363949 RepID=UPI0037FB3FD1